jgi:hypothetical protein
LTAPVLIKGEEPAAICIRAEVESLLWRLWCENSSVLTLINFSTKKFNLVLQIGNYKNT